MDGLPVHPLCPEASEPYGTDASLFFSAFVCAPKYTACLCYHAA